jgi:hypothetical protein
MTLADFAILSRPFSFIAPNIYFAFEFVDLERTWWRLFQNGVAYTKFDIYVFIKLVCYQILWLWTYPVRVLSYDYERTQWGFYLMIMNVPSEGFILWLW